MLKQFKYLAYLLRLVNQVSDFDEISLMKTEKEKWIKKLDLIDNF